MQAAWRVTLVGLCLLGCSTPVALRPTQPSGLTYFKADATTKLGQPTAIVARLVMPTGCYGDGQLIATVVEAAKQIALTGTIRDLTPPGAGCLQAIAYTDASTHVTLGAAGTYRVQARLYPGEFPNPYDVGHLHPTIVPPTDPYVSREPVEAWQEIQVQP
jgi:hypothetical protein